MQQLSFITNTGLLLEGISPVTGEPMVALTDSRLTPLEQHIQSKGTTMNCAHNNLNEYGQCDDCRAWHSPEAFDQVKPNTITHRPDVLPDLGYFTGTENYYRHPMPLTPYEFNYTDGVKHVADYAGAYWLLDVIFSHVAEVYRSRTIPTEQKRLLVCRLAVGDNNKAIFAMTDGNDNALAAQEIEYTDFPAKLQTIWVQNGVAMLPSEY